MFSLVQTTGYAIRALGCLGDASGRFIQAGQIATCTRIPLPYLSKILSELTRAGFVEGRRGHRGGFRLTRPADTIALAQVAAHFEAPAWLGRCVLGLDACTPEEPCPAHRGGAPLRTLLHEQLQALSVADMARYEQQASIGRMGCCSLQGDGAAAGSCAATGPCTHEDTPPAPEPSLHPSRGSPS